MRKKILASMVAGAAVLGLVTACGGNQPPEPTPAPAPAEPQTVELGAQPEEAPAPSETIGWHWDFTEGEARIATWDYMDEGAAPHSDGVLLALNAVEGPVAVKRGVRMEADDYSAVRVRATLEDGTPLRRVRFFWARDAEVEVRREGWPFSEERVVRMQQDASDPTLWEARLSGHPLWDGEMEGFFLEFALPSAIDLDETEVHAILTEVALMAAN